MSARIREFFLTLTFAVVAIMLGSSIAYGTSRGYKRIPCSDTRCISPTQHICTFQLYYRCVFVGNGCVTQQCPL